MWPGVVRKRKISSQISLVGWVVLRNSVRLGQKILHCGVLRPTAEQFLGYFVPDLANHGDMLWCNEFWMFISENRAVILICDCGISIIWVLGCVMLLMYCTSVLEDIAPLWLHTYILPSPTIFILPTFSKNSTHIHLWNFTKLIQPWRFHSRGLPASCPLPTWEHNARYLF